jgi:hypothetical protein
MGSRLLVSHDGGATTVEIPSNTAASFDDYVWSEFERVEGEQIRKGVDRILFDRVVSRERHYRYFLSPPLR